MTTMRKIFFFSIILIGTLSSFAQESVVSSQANDSSFTIAEDDELSTKEESDFAKEVLGDTTISFNDFSIQRDTVSAIKLKRDYSWITNIDSFLLAQKMDDNMQSKIVIKQNSGNSFISNFLNSGILQVLMWIIAASLVLFIIYKLFLSEAVFNKRKTKAGINLQTEELDIHLVNDYDKLLNVAYADGNWRFAMRYLFLKTLQKLNENEMIKYAVDKTNSVYVLELPVAKKNDFASLALYYEYIWYGKVEIQKNIFDSIQIKYDHFLNKI